MENIINRIHEYSLEEIMGTSFGRYSKTIIQDRALPDVRDGLKPVQRRILYSMYRSKNTYDKPTRKSAKAVGDIMGNFHPHGDSSIYDAIVRMSQWWKQNTPLIDMQGNNGSMDGDGAAAMRYTEARLSKISNEFLRDIDKDTVLWTRNYDDTLMEPTVLPARFPNLLVNGSNGISAGYATNIPPHNLSEIIDATVKRIKNPNCTLEDIMEIVKGPDFPTGAIVEGKEGIIEAFRTGRGKIIVKAKTEFVKNKGKEQIVISEIPYEVNKQLLVKKINDLRIDKKIEGIADARDESDKDGLSIVIDLKKDADKDLVLNYLFKNTELQVAFSYNMVAIVNLRPMTLGIIDILDAYIAHQKEVVTRRTNFDLSVAKKEHHITAGLIKALSILDDVIATIRASKNKEDSINNLVKKFDFTVEQATAIVNLQLYRLTNTDVVELEERCAVLEKIIASLTAILENEKKGDAILRSAILASKDVDKNTLMLKNIAGIARNNGKDVVVLCSDERKSAWEKEETEDFTKIKDYVLTIKNNLMNDTVIANTVFILDFGKDSILNYDNNFNVKEDTLFLSTISRLHNNYVYLTSNELFTSFEEFISKYKPLHHGIYDVYQEKSGIYELLK